MRWSLLTPMEVPLPSNPRIAALPAVVALAEAIQAHSTASTLVVVDCLTLWLTNLLMPAQGEKLGGKTGDLALTIAQINSPLILISNEIGLGVIPMGRETREFVDELGRLNQAVAKACDRVTLMAAGLPLVLKDGA